MRVKDREIYKNVQITKYTIIYRMQKRLFKDVDVHVNRQLANVAVMSAALQFVFTPFVCLGAQTRHLVVATRHSINKDLYANPGVRLFHSSKKHKLFFLSSALRHSGKLT